MSIEPLLLAMDFSRAERPDEEFAFQFEPQRYHSRGSDGRIKAATFPWDEALMQDLEKVNLPRCDADVVQRIGDRLGDFLSELGWTNGEDRVNEAVRDGRPIHITIRSSAAELYALPWELLTVRPSRQHVGELPGVLVRYEWPGTLTTPEQPKPRIATGRILFVWSAAGGAVPADAQLAAIQRACAKGFLGFDPAKDVLANATFSALADALRAATPDEPISMIHILCHGAADGNSFGLAFNGERGRGEAIVDAGDMRRLLARHAASVRAVVISACDGGNIGAPGSHLGSVAQAIHQAGVQAVIASRFTLSSEGSIELTETLYDELLRDPGSLETAFVRAREKLVQGDPEKLDWAALQLYSRAEDGDDTRPIVFRPYRGLLAFQPRHSRFFAGREVERAELLERVEKAEAQKTPRLQIVAAASGTGKSSLVLAGLVPDLTSKPDNRWDVLAVRPADKGGIELLFRGLQRLRADKPPESVAGAPSSRGGDGPASKVSSSSPVAGIPSATAAQVIEEAKLLRASHPDRRLLIIIDQLEEIFVPGWTSLQREVAAQVLWELSRSAECGIVILCTIRIDFLGRCGEIVINDGPNRLRLDKVVYDPAHTFFVPQIQAEQLAEIIRKPAVRAGLFFEEGLVEVILADVGEDTSALPLVEHALDELWERREGSWLTQQAYRDLGTFKGALTRAADTVLEQMSDLERAQARRLLVRMVTPAEVGGVDQRQRGWTDLGRPTDPDERKAYDGALSKLVKSRLVVAGDDTPEDPEAGGWAELAHDALIRSWPTLRRWVTEDREMLIQIADLRRSCNTWTTHLSNPHWSDYLLRGDPLDAALAVAQKAGSALDPDIRGFIEASRKAEADAAQAHEEKQRVEGGRRRVLTIALSLWGAVCALLIFAAYRSTMQADEQGKMAQAEHRRATNVALLAFGVFYLRSDPTLAAALLREVESPEEAKGWFQAAASAMDSEIAPIVLQAHDNQVVSIEASPDGERLLTASLDGKAKVYRADGSGEPLILAHDAPVLSARWSPRGDKILTASRDKTARIWSAAGALEATFTVNDIVVSALWSPDGGSIAAVSPNGVRIFRVGGSQIPLLLRRDADITSAAFSPDGERLVATSADGTTAIWSLGRPDEPVILKGDAPAVAAVFSPDGSSIAVTSQSPIVRIWDARGLGAPIALDSGADARSAAFSPDGTRLAVATEGRYAVIHRIDGSLHMMLRHQSAISALAWSPDGMSIATASEDGAVRSWVLPPIENGVAPPDEVMKTPEIILQNSNTISSILWLENGERLATASVDGEVRIWSAGSTSLSVVLRSAGRVRSARFSPNGEAVVLVSGKDGSRGSVFRFPDSSTPVILWDDERDHAESAGWSPDGKRIVAAFSSGQARVYNADGAGKPLVLHHEQRVRAAAWSPDGKRIVTASDDHSARIWASGSEEPSPPLRHEGPVLWAAWSPKGDRIATASADGNARIFDVDHPDKPLVSKHDGPVSYIAWSPNGAEVATISSGNEVRVIDARKGKVSVLAGDRCGAADMLWWSRDGRRLLLRSTDNAACVVSADFSGKPLLLKHAEAVTWAAWSPDGATILTTSEDGAARLFRADGGSEMGTLREHTDGALTGSYSPDGEWIITGSADGTARILPGNARSLVSLLWRATSFCPSVDERMRLLGEPEESAKVAYEACLSHKGRGQGAR